MQLRTKHLKCYKEEEAKPGSECYLGGTATPRAVPTQTWFQAAIEGLSPDVTVYMAIYWVVHCQVFSGGTVTFSQGW
jgi:hypothetical protein